MGAVPEPQINFSFYLLIIFGLFCLILKAIQLFWRKQNMVKALSSFPGPPSHWLYGHVKMVSCQLGVCVL